MDAEGLKSLNIGGLYLAPPHGELIWEGRKKSIIRPDEYTLRGQYILVSGKKAYGVVSIGSMKVIPVTQFDDLFPEHRVTVKERYRWWPDAQIVFSHEVTDFKRCDTLVPVVVPSGVGMLMGRVEFGTRRAGGETMPYSSLAGANPAIRGIKPPVTLSQANSIASQADAIPKDDVKSPWAVAIASFKKSHRVEGGRWVKKSKSVLKEALDATDEGDVVILRGTKDEEVVEEVVPVEAEEATTDEAPSEPEPETTPVDETPDEEEPEKVETEEVVVVAEEVAETSEETETVAETAEVVPEDAKTLKASWTTAKEAIADLVKALADSVKTHVGGADATVPTGPITLVKGASGETLLITRTTNAFKDREGEIFSTQSLHDYVDRHREDETKGTLRYRHVRGTDFGNTIFQGVQGRFLLEVHKFHDNATGQAMQKVFEQYPNGHPKISPEGWGVSHGFQFMDHDLEDGVYKRFEKVETSVLPAHVAANPYTNVEVITMDERGKQEFSDLVTPEVAAQQLAGADGETERLEKAGVECKELDQELVKAIVTQVGEAYKLGELSTNWTAMTKQMTQIGERLAVIEKGDDERLKEKQEEMPSFGWTTPFRASQAEETVTAGKTSARPGGKSLKDIASGMTDVMLAGGA